MKLLCGLYEPDEGRVLVDGIDLAEYVNESWQRRLAVINRELRPI